jgi:hypothetical protein
VNPDRKGTKAAPHYRRQLGAGGQEVIRLRLTDVAPAELAREYWPDGPFGGHFAEVLQWRSAQADDYYATIVLASLDANRARVMRQALAGMRWSKQLYYYNINIFMD